MNESIQIEFSVRYQLAEYLQFVKEEVFSSDELRDLSGIKRFFTVAFLMVFATAMFLIKSHRVGKCVFTIDSSSIKRHSRGGEAIVQWSEVKVIYQSNIGYLIELKSEGGIPVQMRVLNSEQIRLFEQFSCSLLELRHSIKEKI